MMSFRLFAASCLFFVSVLSLISFAHPIRSLQAVESTSFAQNSDIQHLLAGNAKFRAEINEEHPGFLNSSGNSAQAPPFMFLGCSDSRVSEGTIFHSLPGELFAERNIANQFRESDTNAEAALIYAVEHLGVSHILVTGHYGCGGVATAITTAFSPPDMTDPIQRFIQPVRKLYLNSDRPEIVQLREENRRKEPVPTPELHEPGFRALVEENVKVNVERILKAARSVHESGKDVYVHGWVYDMENGKILDLDVSVKV
ncbi:Carbonic anhydrase [Pleurotus pulmonarius]